MNINLTFLHGFLGCKDDWQPTIQDADLSSFAKYAFNIPTADSWDQGILQITENIREDSILIGYSMGARLALTVAMELQEKQATQKKLRGLVLVSGCAGIDDAEKQARKDHDARTSEELLECDSPEQLDAFLNCWYRQRIFSSLSNSEVEALCKKRATIDRRRQAKLLSTFSVSNQPDYRKRIGELKCPTLVLVGQLDQKYVDFAQQLPTRANQTIAIVPDSGHIVHDEQPQYFTSKLRGFAEEVANYEPSI